MREQIAVELTILMPCLNEANTLQACIEKAQAFITKNDLIAEILVADNGSTDGSQYIAQNLGATVINVPVKGYGAALMAGMKAAKGKYVVMGDSDDSYNFSRLELFLNELRKGRQLVMGDRFKGGIARGAMPLLHRYLGNPVLSFIGRLLFSSKIRDFHCGLRGFNRQAMLSLNLSCPGMEFASEMVIKASIAAFDIAQVPTTLDKDGRGRAPHLRTWRDGWRHLRFMLLFSPKWLFFYPGAVLSVMGTLGLLLLAPGALVLSGIKFDIHTMLFSGTSLLIGVQLLVFGVMTRKIGTSYKLLAPNPMLERLIARFAVERGIVVSSLVLFCGMAMSVYALRAWSMSGYGDLDPMHGMRLAIPAVTLLALGVQGIFASMVLGFLELRIDDTVDGK